MAWNKRKGDGDEAQQEEEEEREGDGDGGLLGDLPQECLVSILSRVSPRDVCRLALVSRIFMEASRADALWEQMLPAGYGEALAQADGGPLLFSSKRELYDRICHPILLKNGTEAYWLDRATGGTCYMLSARALRIVWGSDPRYWKWTQLHGSRFHEVAHLEDVCWLEASGHLNSYLPPGAYTISFRLQLVDEPFVFPPAPNWSHLSRTRNWNYAPVKFSLLTVDGQHSQSQRYLDGAEVPNENQLQLLNLTSARVLDGGWMEYDVGEFTVNSIDERVEVQFSMIEIEGGHWKTGLYLDGAMIRPSYLVPH